MTLGVILARQLPVLHYSDKKMDDSLSEAAFDLYLKQLDFQKRFLLQSDVEQLNAFAADIDDELLSGRITLPDAGYDILNERIDMVEQLTSVMLADDSVSGLSPNAGSVATDKAAQKVYVVKQDDTVSSIAAQFPGVSVPDLLQANSMEKPAVLDPGRQFILPAPWKVPTLLQVGIFNMTTPDKVESEPKKMKFVKDTGEMKDKWRQILKMQIISQYLDMRTERAAARRDGKPGKDDIAVKNDIEVWKMALAKVKKRNKNFFHRLRQETLQDHYDRFFNAVTRAFGPHTNYIAPASKEQFDINMRGSLEGIGAMLREEDGVIRVTSIVPGSASARTGKLKAQDIIIEVAQEGEEPIDVTDMRLRDAVRLIRGPKGSTVSLTVKKSDGSIVTVPIVRDVVQLEETFVKSAVLDGGNGMKVGYIYLPSFYRDFDATRNGNRTSRNSTDDTRKAIEELKEKYVDGIILDLRDDGGGALVDAVDITGLFIGSGPVVTVRNNYGEQRTLTDTRDTIYYDGPLVVLVNKFSASASEIVAAALQDYGRAVIIGGKHTHGKGSVQTVVDLNDSKPFLSLQNFGDLGALKVTIQKFYRINGCSTQWKGVEPDIELPDLFAHVKSEERYLDYSLPWDSLSVVPCKPWRRPLFLKELKRRSAGRVAASEKFHVIEEEAAKAKKRAEDTMIDVELNNMLNKRLEVEMSEDKVGDLFKLHGTMDENDIRDGLEPTPEEQHQKWLKEIKEDPYVLEGEAVLQDVRNLQNQ
ncbi:carboxy terminal-processing peptidase [Desulforhopalus vacuolatus]|uniref:carboxy terminal-processing peptidase n=1 Tax=Desulforhopalus vacuolatus TaxID=40414 RepID=UPI00196264F0|nr:carboxy terminal-processing peptidase [Desulforhopalus vacuolatus]